MNKTNLVIPESYYTKEYNVKLTEQDIGNIIEQLEQIQHNVFVFMNMDKIIAKLEARKEV